MNCKMASQKLGAYLDGELSGAEMLALRGHLRDCGACAEEAESLRSLKSALFSLSCCPAPEGLEQRLMSAIRCEAAPLFRRGGKGLLWGSALVAVATAGFLFVWLAIPRPGAPTNLAVKADAPASEVSRDQAYATGADPLSGPTMVVTASYDSKH